MTYVLGIIALVFAVKGFGGSFRLFFPENGGPIIGTTLAVLLIAFFLLHPRFAHLIPGQVLRFKKIFVVILALVIIGAGVLIRAQKITHTPLEIRSADMLPFIQVGLDDILAGKSPYRSHTLAHGGTYPHFYMPGLWLPYLPFHVLGWDLRWWNIFAQLIFGLCLLDIFVRRRDYPINAFQSSAVFLGVLALQAFSKQSVSEVVAVQTGTFWLTTSLWLWATWRKKPLVGAFSIAFLLLCRETAFVLVLPFAIWSYQHERARFWQTAKICTVVIGIIIAPFLIATPKGFFAAIPFYSSLTAGPVSELNRYFGLSGVLKQAGILSLLPVFQWAAPLVSVIVAVAGKIQTRVEAIGWGAAAYTAFMLFAPVTMAYLYAEPLIVASFLLIGAVDEGNAPFVTSRATLPPARI